MYNNVFFNLLQAIHFLDEDDDLKGRLCTFLFHLQLLFVEVFYFP
jgi:hypothetical protein